MPNELHFTSGADLMDYLSEQEKVNEETNLRIVQVYQQHRDSNNNAGEYHIGIDDSTHVTVVRLSVGSDTVERIGVWII